MTSCEKAATICNKAQYGEASFLERISLNLHLLICKTCAVFSKKNAKLTTLCKESKLHGLSEQEKLKMKEHLQNRP